MAEQDALLTVQQLAAYLNFSMWGIRSRVRKRQLPYIRVGNTSTLRFSKRAIDEMLAAGSVAAEGGSK